MRKLWLPLVVIATLFFYNCTNRMKITTLTYPETRMDNIVEDYHGTAVQDPYRWLEDDNSEETAQWVKAQNLVTFDYLEQIPYREQMKNRLTELWDYPKYGIPEKHGDHYYIFMNDGLRNQSVMYRMRSLSDKPELFFDPNTLSDNGTIALSSATFSKDGKYFAYGISESGSDWVQIRIMSTETLKNLDETIRWVKFSSANWDAASKGFYYSRYDEPLKEDELSAKNQFQKVYYHTLGEDQSQDKLIFADSKHPLRYYRCYESKDGKYVFIYGSEGTHGTELLYRETGGNVSDFKVLLSGFEYDYGVVHSEGDKLLVYTNNSAENYRLALLDLSENKPTLTDVIAEDPDHLLEGVSEVAGYLFASYLIDAQHQVRQYDLAGNHIRNVELETIGTVSGFRGDKDTHETFYALSTFTAPAKIYRYALSSGKSELIRESEVSYDPSQYVTEQIFFESKDGTKVPMFVVHKKGITLDGKNPTLMYGYGGFNISVTPAYKASNIMFLEQGGVYVVVNLRGGGEYGEEWHSAGMLEKKQNVFDDFISAAEYLIDNKYTSKGKLAIMGGSNGGLLVGACMIQRPDLFAVTFPMVGVLDMLRYHKFTVGWGWVVEYGSPDKAEDFEYLYKYSPLHNVKEGTCYPATMVMTADHDDRVVPAHSFKFAAELQRAQGCDNPVLIRIDTDAGHGAGKPTSKRIEEDADVFSFLFWNTDTKVNL